jgi:hypothetical protein
MAAKFSKFFGNSIQSWFDLQLAADLAEIKRDKELQGELKAITKVKKPKAAAKAKESSRPSSRGRASAKNAVQDAPKTRGRKPKAKVEAAPAPEKEPKKRGRKAKEKPLLDESAADPAPKKRGRKPKEVSAGGTFNEPKIPKKRGRKAKSLYEVPPDSEEKPFVPHHILIKQKRAEGGDESIDMEQDTNFSSAEPELFQEESALM